MTKNKVIENILKIIVLVIFGLLAFVTKSLGYAMWNGDENGGMPSFSGPNGPTGLLPQILYS